MVPHTLHPEMIQLLHTGHLRLEKCLNRAKESMYWPGLYEEFKDLVMNCTNMLEIQLTKTHVCYLTDTMQDMKYRWVPLKLDFWGA